MSDENQSTSGDNAATSGASESMNTNEPSDSKSYSEQFIKKLNTEKDNWRTKAKQLEERLNEFEAKEKEQHENTLKEQQKWQEYAKLKEQERDQIAEQFNNLHTQVVDSQKFQTLLHHVNGEVKKQYWGLLRTHLNEIVVNPETNDIDEVSVKTVADKVREMYPDIIVSAGGPKVPNGAAQPGQYFSLEKWDSMSAKEKKEHLPEFVKQWTEDRK
jgi:hypothetical protein